MAATRLEQLANGTLTIAAIAIAAVVVKRELGGAEAGPPALGEQGLSFVEDWEGLLSVGRRVAGRTASVQLIEFIDLECPGCQAFEVTLRDLRRELGESLGVTYVHFPLPFHEGARDAAVAAECAARHGRFDEMVSFLLEKRDSLFHGRWAAWANQLEIRDTLSFRGCLGEVAAAAMVDEGLDAGKRIGVRATPTILVNGWRFRTVPTGQELRSVIASLRAGRPPPFVDR